MSDATEPSFERLVRELPREAGTEIILRRSGERATATLRHDGRPPRVFVDTATGPCELLPSTDTDLPGHLVLAAPAALRSLLEPHTGAIAGSQVVAWRPGRRAVVQVQLASGATAWLKLLDRKTWKRAQRAFAAVGDALEPMHLCLPQQLLPEVCGYLAAPARGRSLRTLLAAGEAPPMTLLSRGLLALGYTRVRGELPVVDFLGVRTATLDMLAKGGVQRPDLHELSAAVASMKAPEATTGPGFVHGDLHDKQLFVGEDTTSLIDLEGIATGDSRFDLANLAEHVRLRDLQQHGRDLGLADLLLARCGLHPDAAATRAFRAVVRARLCGVYALRPRWTTLVAQLRSETLQLLANLS